MRGWYEHVVAALAQHGYSRVRSGKGAHEIWGNGRRHQVVSRNMPSRHMANEIMKQAGIARRF